MLYSIKYIAAIVGGRLVRGHGDDPVEHLLLDSRRLIFPATSLFFALKGPRRDGRIFIEELYRRGVRNFVVQGESPAGEDTEGEGVAGFMADANIILVEDTLAALQALAAWHRRQFTLPVVGITGSNGKTIVKEWLNQLLEDGYHIVRSPKSYNSQTGVPLSVWQLQAVHELAIFEAGISRRGEMRKLEAIIQPTIGIFTNIGEAHSEGFDSRMEKAREKLALFERAEVLIYCGDQPETVRAVHEWRPGADRPVLMGWGRGADVAVKIHSMEKLEGWTTIGGHYSGQDLSFSLPFTDDPSIENALHCVCVLLLFGLKAEAIQDRLVKLAPIAMRLELKSGINHCSIINDSYSADLSSLSIALDFLSQQQQHVRRTVILSDILESGRAEEDLYTEVARVLGQKKVDRLVGIGARIGAYAAVFTGGGWFRGQASFYPTVEDFKKDWHQLHFRDETILIKGARVFEFEEIDRLLSEQIHQTVLEVNLNAMASNLRQYRQLLQPATRVMAMVKAYAYGSGSFEIANLLQFHGVDYLGVAYADEGVVLRKAGIRVPVMVMNTENSSFDLLVEYNLEPVIYSFSLFRSFDRWLKKEGILSFPVHIELETGMNRLGFPLSDLEALAAALGNAAFKVQSVFSHLAASEEAQQDDFSRRQGASYLAAADRLQEVLPYPFLRHIANSAAILRHPTLQLDMVRLGIGLYGIDSADSHRMDLQEVSTLKTTIAQIKHLKEGDTIGYSRKGVATPGMVIATVRIGYADGYPRRLGNGMGKMWVRGRLAPVVGAISMDMTMIDITGIPDIKEGDEVVVFGNELSVNQLAHWAQTIPYEILTGVSQRVKRVYFEE
ncbi:MAG TPA: bifunctional UDP-N-acetylmuramoyl-tripeptide:D-alanyl-D-alanine ligase/alanine racemase [Puia sp.]